MAISFVNVDTYALPPLPQRMKWRVSNSQLIISAQKTRWSPKGEEAVYFCDDCFCFYWLLKDSREGYWAGEVPVTTTAEAIAVLHAWCLMGIAEFALLSPEQENTDGLN